MNQSFYAWLKASRIPSQLYLLLSILWGQAYCFYLTGEFSPLMFLLLLLYGISNQLFIVFGNDVADYESDRINKHYTSFSGGSRVLVLGLLSTDQLSKACKRWGMVCALLGVMFSFFISSVKPVILVLTGLGLLWAYSYPPLRMSYRGCGEVLQGIGLGFILPLLAFYIQGGQAFHYGWFVPLFLVQLSCSVATALPDRIFDGLSGKKTLAVKYGQEFCCRFMFGLNCISIIIIGMVLAFLSSGQIFLFLGIPLLSSLGFMFLSKSEPGRFLMSLCVFLAILSSLSQMVIMTVFFITVA